MTPTEMMISDGNQIPCMPDIATERHSHAAFRHDRQSVPCDVRPLHTGNTSESSVGNASDVHLLPKQTPLGADSRDHLCEQFIQVSYSLISGLLFSLPPPEKGDRENETDCLRVTIVP